VSTAQRVIDDIDALVDEQLRQEASGYDHNLNQPRCRWCDREWHGKADVWCRGSDVQGPLSTLEGKWARVGTRAGAGYDNGGWLDPGHCPTVHLRGMAIDVGTPQGSPPSPGLIQRVPSGYNYGDPEDLREAAEVITAAFRVVSAEVSRVWESIRRTLLGLPHPQAQAQSRCALAARRRMHSDQLRVQRRAVRRERRARQREAKHDPLEVHDDHVILTLTPDVSDFRRELRRTYDQP